MSAVPHSPFVSPTSFCGRLGVSWRASLSPRSRYEVGSLIAILGLILTLIGTTSVHAALLRSVLTPTLFSICAALHIHPLAAAIVSVVIGLLFLLGGIFLLPVQQEPPKSSLLYLTTSP